MQLGATNVECRCCRVAPSGTERRSVMDKSAAVLYSGSPLNAECDALVVDAECGALCGLAPLMESVVVVEWRRVTQSAAVSWTRVPQCLVVRC